METKNTVGMILAITVSMIMVGTLLVPTVSDVTATTATFDNKDFARHQMKELEDGDEWTRADGVWYYNGETLTTSSSGSAGVIFTDNLSVREVGNIRGTNYKTSANSTNSVEVVAVDELTLGLSINESTSYASFTYGYGAVQSGDLIMKNYDKSAYVLKDTDMYITGTTSLDNTDPNAELLCVISGSIEDGFTVTASNVKNSTLQDITVGTVTVNAEAVEGYEDLYLFDSISFTLSGTQNAEEMSITATYSTFVMPKTVTAELTNHMDAAQIAIMSIVPIFMILAIMMIAVRFVTRD